MLLEDFLQAGLGHAPCAFIAAISHAQWLVSQNVKLNTSSSIGPTHCRKSEAISAT